MENGSEPPNRPMGESWQAAASLLADNFRALVQGELNAMKEETKTLRQQATELAQALADERAALTDERAARAAEQETAQAQRLAINAELAALRAATTKEHQEVVQRLAAAERELLVANEKRQEMATNSSAMREELQQEISRLRSEKDELRELLHQEAQENANQLRSEIRDVAGLLDRTVPQGAVFAFDGELPLGYEWAVDVKNRLTLGETTRQFPMMLSSRVHTRQIPTPMRYVRKL